MFGMDHEFDPRPDAGRWQISTPGILGSSTLYGSLGLFAEAGLERLRAKSLAMTGYLMALADEHLAAEPHGFRIGTPREPGRRGGHVALEHENAAAICEALVARGVVPDFRPPDVIRICPAPLYGTFHEVWLTVQHLMSVVDGSAAARPG
jgi:kynureninase